MSCFRMPLIKDSKAAKYPTCALVALLAAPAWASGDEHVPIEEIIVTGERPSQPDTDLIQAGTFRGASQLDTPMVVAVIPDTVIASQQAENLQEVIRNTPGVTGLLVSPAVYSNVSIRGIPVDPRTNYKLNGSLSVVNFIDLPLENKSRVEVLKGVSALYYGFATPAGIVNLVTWRPPRDQVLTLSSWMNDHGQLQGALEGGFTRGVLGLRGTFAGGSIDQGIARTRGHRDFQAAALQIDPSPAIRFNLDIERIHKEVTEPTILQGPTGRAFLLAQLPRLPRASTNPGSISFLNRAGETNVLARTRWSFLPNWSLTAEAGISHARRDRRFSFLAQFDPGSGLGILTLFAADDQLFRNRSLRADISGSFQTGPLTHHVVIGASHNRRLQYSPPGRMVAGTGGSTVQQGCIALGLAPTCVQNAFDPEPLNNVTFDGSVRYDPARYSKGTDDALYAFDRIEAGRLSVIAGIRQAFYREYVATADDNWRRTFVDNPVTLSGAAIFKPIDHLSLYASYIEGIESVPPAPNFTANQGEILAPGESRQWEIGFKFVPMAGLLVNAAYFDIERQLLYVNSDNRFVNDGTGRYRGIELAASGQLGPDLSIILTALYMDARQDIPSDAVIDGLRPENSARLQWSAFAEYKLSKLLRGLTVNMGAFYVGKRAINPENSLFVEGYMLVDAGAAYEFAIGSTAMTARISGHNLAGKRYIASTGSNILAMGVPPSVRVSLTAKVF